MPPSSIRTPSPLARCARSISARAGVVGDRAGELGQRDPQHADRPVARDVRRGRRRGAADALEARRRRGRAGRSAAPRPRRRRRLPDDVDGVRAALREALVEQLRGGARLRAGRRVVGRPVAGEPGRGERGGQGDDPGRDDRPAAPEGQVGQARQAAARSRGSGHWGGPPRGVRWPPVRGGGTIAARTIDSATLARHRIVLSSVFHTTCRPTALDC